MTRVALHECRLFPYSPPAILYVGGGGFMSLSIRKFFPAAYIDGGACGQFLSFPSRCLSLFLQLDRYTQRATSSTALAGPSTPLNHSFSRPAPFP